VKEHIMVLLLTLTIASSLSASFSITPVWAQPKSIGPLKALLVGHSPTTEECMVHPPGPIAVPTPIGTMYMGMWYHINPGNSHGHIEYTCLDPSTTPFDIMVSVDARNAKIDAKMILDPTILFVDPNSLPPEVINTFLNTWMYIPPEFFAGEPEELAMHPEGIYSMLLNVV